jgi:hypothetical protein
MVKTAKAKRAEQAAGIAYGCHVDLAPDEQPDGCVIDDGIRRDCVYAVRHRTREGCKYWLPIQMKCAAHDR